MSPTQDYQAELGGSKDSYGRLLKGKQ